jgi:hypothetical protein
MIERGTLTRFATAGAVVAMAMAAACSSSSQGTPGESGGVDSGNPETTDASTSGHEDAPASDATSDTGSSSSSGGGSLDSGPADHDGASDAADIDSSKTPDAGGKDGAADGGGKDGAADGGGKDGAADGGATALATACTALCMGQSSLSCSMDLADCESTCLAQAGDTENPAVSCETQYTAMAQCEAKLRANQWVCSESNVVPIPVPGQCTTTLCAWSCCVGSDYADPDVWSVCMPQCP